MKKSILLFLLITTTLIVSGCEINNLFKSNDEGSADKLDCKVNEGYEDSMEGNRYVFTFVDGYVTEKEVSIEFDTKEEAKTFYDSVSNDSANVLDDKRVYYVQRVSENEKYTREDVIEAMEKQHCTCK